MRPGIGVTVALSTLLGVDEQPGELAGHGPIPASLARRLAADETGTWRRLVTEPVTGQLLDYGHDNLPPAQRPRRLRDRPRPGLHVPRLQPTRPPLRSGSSIPYDKGGSTSSENLGPLCQRHHICKHDTRLDTPPRQQRRHHHLDQPHQHTYRSRPPDLPQDTTSDPPPF